MEVRNIIIVIIRIRYMGMNGYLFKSEYNKMKVNDGDGDGYGLDAAVDAGDDTQALKDPSPSFSFVVVMVDIFRRRLWRRWSDSAPPWWLEWMLSSSLAPHSFI
jgi:hypothetical protein